MSAERAERVSLAGRTRRQIEIQTAVQEQALIHYESTALAALEEVENALIVLANARSRRESLQNATDAALLARHRYTAGATDFRTVLDTERTALSLEDDLSRFAAAVSGETLRLGGKSGSGQIGIRPFQDRLQRQAARQNAVMPLVPVAQPRGDKGFRHG